MRLRVTHLLLVLLALAGGAAGQRSADQWYAQGQAQLRAGQPALAARSFQEAVRQNPSAANWRALAEAQLLAGDHAHATQAFDQAVQLYRARGDAVTAQALANRAAPYRQELGVYLLGQPAAASPAGCARSLAKLEPAAGLDLGLYVDEQGLTPDGTLRAPNQLGSPLAVYFRYFTLRDPQGAAPEDIFPSRLAGAVRRAGGALHLALEPGLPLSEISEATLTPFAQAARAADLPIFLRFAGEFNDPANPWSRDPALYRAKFRLVHDVMARLAPKVAMVWMAMPSRLETLDAYFPGDDAVDWVGISLYSVPFLNGDRAASTLNQDPLDVLKPFYDKYACRHPFQVSEFASSSRSQARPEVDYSAWAADKLRALYWGAALKFPRLKNINWLDLNMIGNRFAGAKGSDRRNDYRLLDSPAKLAAFRELLAHPYFLTAPAGPGAGSAPAPFPARLRVTGDLQGALYLKTFEAPGRVTITLDGAAVPVAQALPYRFTLPASRLGPGPHQLTVRVLGAGGAPLVSQAQAFTVER